MKNYSPAINSVGHALRLAHLMQREGQLSVSEAAGRPGIVRFAARRLLAMRACRDFAGRGSDRRCRPSPVPYPAAADVTALGDITGRFQGIACAGSENAYTAWADRHHSRSVRLEPDHARWRVSVFVPERRCRRVKTAVVAPNV